MVIEQTTLRSFKKIATGFVAFVYLIVAIGWVPNIRQPLKNDGPAFPCQGCSCSCSSAVQCWTNCCCFTRAERIIWAKSNGVSLSDSVVSVAKTRDQSQCCCDDDEGKQGPVREEGHEDQLAIGVPECFQLSTQWLASQSVLLKLNPSLVVLETPPFFDTTPTTSCQIPQRWDAPPKPVPIFSS